MGDVKVLLFAALFLTWTSQWWQGKKGEPGDTGPTGPQGQKGEEGNKGQKGTRGLQGLQGPIGSTGVPGLAGRRGARGPEGPRGEKGIQGGIGPIGPKGDAGLQGMKGEHGDTGPTGPQGQKGEEGNKGQKGTRGLQGLQGPIGSTGVPGLAGQRGARGPEGPRGEKGIQGGIGPIGPKGDAGLQGMKGEHGDAGPTGPQGKKGEEGSKGQKGSRGLQGLQGPTGDQGVPGAVGQRGARGTEGPEGERGPQGVPGSVGPPGPQGPHGDTVVSQGEFDKIMLAVQQIIFVQLNRLGGADKDTQSVFTKCSISSTNWRRVVYIDMTDPTAQCPSGLREVSNTATKQRACGRIVDSGCSSLLFPTGGSYTHVCGRVRGYQFYQVDAFNSLNSIGGAYSDGVLITNGRPRRHLWTYAAGRSERSWDCPCSTGEFGSSLSIPTFVGTDYYCESGFVNNAKKRIAWEDPLWDGAGCVTPKNTCCQRYGWFHKQVQQTSDSIEVRWCADWVMSNKDVFTDIVEIWVQ